jgi:Hydrolase of X-linked nucleoside diphosphate N terminal
VGCPVAPVPTSSAADATDEILRLADQLRAIAHVGLGYSEGKPYDADRYRQIMGVAAELSVRQCVGSTASWSANAGTSAGSRTATGSTGNSMCAWARLSCAATIFVWYSSSVTRNSSV